MPTVSALMPAFYRRKGPLQRHAVNEPDTTKARAGEHPLTWAFAVERVKGAEPSLSAWESHMDRSRCGPLPGERGLGLLAPWMARP